jgi:hypothetical protein
MGSFARRRDHLWRKNPPIAGLGGAVYEPERVAAAREGEGPQLPGNHSPLFAPVPKPTIETGVEAMTLAVLSVFDQQARAK